MRFHLFLLLIFFCSCEKSSPVLEGIDGEIWKADKNGCEAKRTLYLNPLTSQLEKLKGLTEMQIVNLLGKPDLNELYKRNQKFYHYWIEPAPSCASLKQNSKKLSIRFNATGRAKEVHID